MKFDSLIFDLDGTLWNAIDRSVEAWSEVLLDYSDAQRGPVTAAELQASVGLTMDELVKKIVPALSPARFAEFLSRVSARESALLAACGGTLYPQVEETLKKLSEDYRLFLVSNCEVSYLNAFFTAHGLQKYFADSECAERTGLPKSENIRLIIERNGLKFPAYVGDTIFDFEACEKAGVPMIFAAYGYGEVPAPALRIERFSDLLILPCE